VGEISYSIYLIHFIMVAIFIARGWYFNFAGRPTESILLTATVIMLPAVLAVSWLTYTVVERPFLDLRKRYMVAPGQPVAVAGEPGRVI
jgi:peptidoglycan/LPS O-acetylase OafA/YrhL